MAPARDQLLLSANLIKELAEMEKEQQDYLKRLWHVYNEQDGPMFNIFQEAIKNGVLKEK